MSLDRLIDLAKRTGDRLIVHDPVNGRDIVILGIDEYEKMILPPPFGKDSESFPAYNEEEFGSAGTSIDDEWDSTGSIIRDRYGDWQEETSSLTQVQESEDISTPPDVMHDDREEQKGQTNILAHTPESDDDEPVFYEEPLV